MAASGGLSETGQGKIERKGDHWYFLFISF